jgi:hypothetical protein
MIFEWKKGFWILEKKNPQLNIGKSNTFDIITNKKKGQINGQAIKEI